MKSLLKWILIPIALIISIGCKRTPETERILKKSERNAVFEQLSSIADSVKLEEMANDSQALDTFEWLLDLDENYQQLRKLMHSRPFWIKDADTVGFIHPCDGDQPAFFKATTFMVPGCIAVSAGAEMGWIAYAVDWRASDTSWIDGWIKIVWQPLPLENEGKPAEYSPGDEFMFEPSATQDTSFTATFKGQPCKVFNRHVRHEAHNGAQKWETYHTDVFFERKGYVYCIAAGCEAQPQFLGPESEWWRWVESHWYWLDEPHPDWSRYPIHRDSIKYEGRFHELPPEELEGEES